MLLMFVCLQEVLQLSSLLVRQLFFPLRFCPEFMGLRITDNLAGHIAGSFRSAVILRFSYHLEVAVVWNTDIQTP